MKNLQYAHPACFVILGVLFLIVALSLYSMAKQAKRRREYYEAQAQAKRDAEAKKKIDALRRQEAAEQAAKAKAEKAAQAAKAKEERERAQAEKRAEKLQYQRELTELKERALQAEKELLSLRAGTSSDTANAAQTFQTSSVKADAAQTFETPQKHLDPLFAGQRVAFTGRIPGMTRKEAIAIVQLLGGKAYETMPANTTMLVVGSKPGMGKLDRADAYIDQVRKITAAQFLEMARAAA